MPEISEFNPNHQIDENKAEIFSHADEDYQGRNFVNKNSPEYKKHISDDQIVDEDTEDIEDTLLEKIDKKRNNQKAKLGIKKEKKEKLKLAKAALAKNLSPDEKRQKSIDILSKGDTPEKKSKREAALKILSKNGTTEKKDTAAAQFSYLSIYYL